MPYFVYIIQSRKNKRFYIGQTKDINDRLKRHNNGEGLATKSGVPWEVVKFENFNTRTEAINRERYLKSLKNKSYLINNIINYSGVEK